MYIVKKTESLCAYPNSAAEMEHLKTYHEADRQINSLSMLWSVPWVSRLRMYQGRSSTALAELQAHLLNCKVQQKEQGVTKTAGAKSGIFLTFRHGSLWGVFCSTDFSVRALLTELEGYRKKSQHFFHWQHVFLPVHQETRMIHFSAVRLEDSLRNRTIRSNWVFHNLEFYGCSSLALQHMWNLEFVKNSGSFQQVFPASTELWVLHMNQFTSTMLTN